MSHLNGAGIRVYIALNSVRILFANDFGYLFGGAEVYALGMAEALRQRGHEVRWLTTDVKGGQSLFRLSDDSDPFHDDWFCRGSESDFRLRRGWQQFHNRSAAAIMGKAIAEWKPDLVHLHGFLSQLSPLVLEPLKGVPVVATAHTYKAICPRATKLRPDATVCESAFGLGCVASQCLSVGEYAHERLKRVRFANLFSRIRFWIAPSAYVQSVYEAEMGVPVRVLYHGTDLHEQRLPKENGKAIVLFAGRLVDTKGVEVLLAAMVRVREELPGAVLWIAGNGPCESDLRAKAKALGLKDGVQFLGHCSRERLIELHRHVDVLAAPALWPEPLPLTVLEAMALGTPVVATAVGGHGDAVIDGWNGRLVPPGNPVLLAAALQTVIANVSVREAFEKAALVAAEKFRLAPLAKELEALYAEARQIPAPMPSLPYVVTRTGPRDTHSDDFRDRTELRGPRQGTWEHGSSGTHNLS